MLKTTDKTWDSFRGGRYTRNNLVKISSDHVLVANQIYFPGDGIAHKRPGYSLVQALNLPMSAGSQIFDFQRQSDNKQFWIIAGGGKITAIVAATGQVLILSAGENATATWHFATNNFALYASNGINSYRFVDTGNGLLTKFNWGIQAPPAAPAIGSTSGTLTLDYGRQYAFSYVSKWTDAEGTQRVHVGPPSPLSASSGPLANSVVEVDDLAASADPQVTNIWIWATNDTPYDTDSTLFFLAEIANGTTTYGDDLPDIDLDTTRVIPYENFPPPAGAILSEYQQRIIIAGIAGKLDLVQMTGLEEIALGIPQETAPTDAFFNVPGGIKAVSGMAEFNSQLNVSTQFGWWPITGSSAETFQEGDITFSPGMAGPDAFCITSTWLVWLGLDKKLWAWNGYQEPIEVSWKIGRADGSTQLSMESMNAAQLATAQIRWITWGRYNLVMVLVSSQQNQYYDWAQIWDISILAGPQSQLGGVLTQDGMLVGAAEGDTFFLDQIIGSGNVLYNNTPYIFLVDVAGNLYQWPNGFQDNGKNYYPVLGSEFTDMDEPGYKKRFRWLDAVTSRIDAVKSFLAAAVVSDGVSLDRKAVGLKGIGPLPPPGAPDPTCFRAKMEQPGTSLGKFMRWFIFFPADQNDCELYKVEVKASVIGKDTR